MRKRRGSTRPKGRSRREEPQRYRECRSDGALGTLAWESGHGKGGIHIPKHVLGKQGGPLFLIFCGCFSSFFWLPSLSFVSPFPQFSAPFPFVFLPPFPSLSVLVPPRLPRTTAFTGKSTWSAFISTSVTRLWSLPWPAAWTRSAVPTSVPALEPSFSRSNSRFSRYRSAARWCGRCCA